MELLVSFGNDLIHFNNDVAEKTFANEKFLGKKITIIGVMGPSRSGKSFLMAILTTKGNDKEIEGSFQSGYERCTVGIYISSHPEYLTDDIINLRGNIGGDSLQDLHLFTEMVSSMNGVQSLPEQLIFLIRDAADSSKDETFLDELWAQTSQSKDLQEISASLRSKFSSIKCYCAPPASDRIRRANGKIQIETEDLPLLQKLNLVKESLLISSQSLENQSMRKTIDYAMKVSEFLQSKENIFERTSIQLIKEATAVYASNKAFSVFEGPFSKAKQENFLQIYEEERRKAFETLKELVYPKDFAEAEGLLNSKITKLFTVKELQLKEETAQKDDQLNIERFFSSERSKIRKLDFETLLKLKRENQMETIITEFVKTLNRLPNEKDFLSLKAKLEDGLDYQFLPSREGHLRKFLDELVNQLREKILTMDTFNGSIEKICLEEIHLSLRWFSDELKRTGVNEEKTEELILFAKEELKKCSSSALQLHGERRVAAELLNTLTKQFNVLNKQQAIETFSVKPVDELDMEDENNLAVLETVDDEQSRKSEEQTQHEMPINDNKEQDSLPQNDTREDLEAQLQADLIKLFHSQNELNYELRMSERRPDVEANYETTSCFRNLEIKADFAFEKSTNEETLKTTSETNEETLTNEYIKEKIIVFHLFEQGLTDFQNKALILRETIEESLKEFEFYCEIRGFDSELVAVKRESFRKDLSLLAGDFPVVETRSDPDLVIVENRNVSDPERTAKIIQWIGQFGGTLFEIIRRLTVSLFQLVSIVFYVFYLRLK